MAARANRNCFCHGVRSARQRHNNYDQVIIVFNDENAFECLTVDLLGEGLPLDRAKSSFHTL